MKVLKNLMGVAIGMMVLASCAKETKGYTIQGEINGVDNGTIYLKQYEDKNFINVDSTAVTNGKFTFKGSTPEARVYGLSTGADTRQPLLFFLENAKMNVKVDENAGTIEVVGSPVNDLYFANAPLVSEGNYSLDSLVRANPDSPVGAYFLMRNFAWQLSLDEIKALKAEFNPSLNGSFYINQIDTLISHLEQLQVGAVAPNFTLPDVDGNPVSLNSFRGKYVLVDFWASWCPDCRKEAPTIVADYQRFKSDNFAMLGVSLDREREPWLAAIKKDGLDWTQVSDLKGWKSPVAELYAIRWVPTSFLISPDGVIIAVEKSAEDMTKNLEKVFNTK